MERNPQTPSQKPLSSAIPKEDIFPQIQTIMMTGKAIETLAVNQARQAIEGSYSQTLELLEEADRCIDRASGSVDDSLCFPFDVMEYAARAASDSWRIVMNLETVAELNLSEQIEKQSKQFSQAEKRLKTEIAVLAQSVSAKDEQLVELQSESEKARKAKQSAQRTQRKLKAELKAYNEKALELEAETITTREKYDQQLSENALLQAQKKQLGLELAEAKQETQKLMTGSEQMVTKIEDLCAEQEKLIAEKDGLHKRIEELLYQLEQSSHYTE